MASGGAVNDSAKLAAAEGQVEAFKQRIQDLELRLTAHATPGDGLTVLYRESTASLLRLYEELLRLAELERSVILTGLLKPDEVRAGRGFPDRTRCGVSS